MSVRPATVTLRVPQRAVLRKRIRIGIDGNGIDIVAQVWDIARKRLYINFAVEWISRLDIHNDNASCIIEIVASPSQTQAMTRDGVWDLKVIRNSGVNEDYFIRGLALLERGYSEN